MIFFYISLVTYFCFLILKGRNGIILLNNSKGDLKKYRQNIMKKGKELFITPELLGIILIIVALNTNEKITGICFVIFYMLLFLYLLRKSKEKFKLKKGNIGLIVALVLLFVLLYVLFGLHYISLHSDFIWFDTQWIYYIISIIIGYLLYFIIWICGVISKAIEFIFHKIHKI